MDKQITLGRVPGQGWSHETIDTNETVDSFAKRFKLTEREIMLDGVKCDKSKWATTKLGDTAEIYATQPTKGA